MNHVHDRLGQAIIQKVLNRADAAELRVDVMIIENMK
jgi:hypothetical protein